VPLGPTPKTFRRLAIEAAGIEVPTFRTPLVTLSDAELDELLQRPSDCEHDIRGNPNHGDQYSPLET
jgi:hypothetical protein